MLVTRDITERELADDAYYTLVKYVESDEFKIAEILIYFSSERDTALMNNSVMVFAVKANELGLVEGRSMIRYRFNNIYETTRWLPFDVGGPVLRTRIPRRTTRLIIRQTRRFRSASITMRSRSTESRKARCRSCCCCFIITRSRRSSTSSACIRPTRTATGRAVGRLGTDLF